MDAELIKQLQRAHIEPVHNYALVIDSDSSISGFTDLTRKILDLYGDDAIIWDSIAEYLHLRYGPEPQAGLDEAAIASLVDTYIGDRCFRAQAAQAFAHFITVHQGALNELLKQLQHSGEQVQSVYSAGIGDHSSLGFMIFECIPEASASCTPP